MELKHFQSIFLSVRNALALSLRPQFPKAGIDPGRHAHTPAGWVAGHPPPGMEAGAGADVAFLLP